MPPIDILIGERDPFMRRALEHILSADYRTCFVDNGATLIQVTHTSMPALIVAEALLPEMDGFQVCQYIKNDPQTSHIPFMFFTWLMARERALQVGADAFLLKPLDAQTFLKTIQRLLKDAGKE